MKKFKWIISAVILCTLLSGCKNAKKVSDIQESVTSASSVSTEALPSLDSTEMFTDRDFEIGYDESKSAIITLEGDTAFCTSDAVLISGSTVTISEEGTYILSGTLTDGTIVVDAENTDKLQLVLNGVNIFSENSAAICILQADKAFLTLAFDSVNTLSNGGTFTLLDGNPIDAVLFSKDDLTINGNGSLTIDSPAGHGIVSKDNLVITSGSYSITAASHGVSGKDSLRIASGSLTITSGKDGLHVENSEDTSLGFLYISGGTFHMTASGDGLSASSALQIEGGDFQILTTGAADSSQSDSVSSKGIKATGNMILNNGSYIIESTDDALHSNASLTIQDGTYQLSTGDDGLHADEALMVTGGTIVILSSYEGLEGQIIDISGGAITLTASDDGLNAAGGNDQSGFSGFFGKDDFAAGSDCYINISGGILHINADGDGIDSNGSLNVSGGETYVSGPQSGGNGSLDYGSEAIISGGIFIAAGSARMAQNFNSNSTQGTILQSFETQAAGSTIELADSNGQVLLTWQSDKLFECVVISCPELLEGSTYTLTAGSSVTEITMDSLVYGSGGTGFGGRGGGPMGGRGGGPVENDFEGVPEGTPPEAASETTNSF